MNEFKDMLRYLRQREGLSQAELADRLGITKSAVSMYENGNRMPSYEMEERIADYFNVGIDFLRGNSSNDDDLDPQTREIAKRVSRLNAYQKHLVEMMVNEMAGDPHA